MSIVNFACKDTCGSITVWWHNVTCITVNVIWYFLCLHCFDAWINVYSGAGSPESCWIKGRSAGGFCCCIALTVNTGCLASVSQPL